MQIVTYSRVIIISTSTLLLLVTTISSILLRLLTADKSHFSQTCDSNTCSCSGLRFWICFLLLEVDRPAGVCDEVLLTLGHQPLQTLQIWENYKIILAEKKI